MGTDNVQSLEVAGIQGSSAGHLVRGMMDIASAGTWAMLPEFYDRIYASISGFDPRAFFFLPFGDDDDDEKPAYEKKGDMAILKIDGPMMYSPGQIMRKWFGVLGTTDIKNTFIAMQNDPDVKRIFLLVRSPGGDADGIEDLSNTIYQYRGTKPVMAYSETVMASAAYWISSAADYVIAGSRTTRVGSIGVISPVHLDVTENLKQNGIKPYVFKAGEYKATPSRYLALTEDHKEYFQGLLDQTYTVFVDDVARNKGVSAKTVLTDMADGKLFIGAAAVEAGLCDEILNMDQAIERLRGL